MTNYKVESLEDFIPWGGAKEVYETVDDAGKLQELQEIIDKKYPDGIEEKELNNLFRFESEWIFEILNIVEDEEERNIRILMEDYCTRKEAIEHLKRGTIVWENINDYIANLKDCDCWEGETEESIREDSNPDMPIVVTYKGKEYLVQYCL